MCSRINVSKLKNHKTDARERGKKILSEEQCLKILQSEVEQAIHAVNNRITPGPDGIPLKFFIIYTGRTGFQLNGSNQTTSPYQRKMTPYPVMISG